MLVRRILILLGVASLCCSACRKQYRDDLDYSYRVVQTWALDELLFSGEVVQFESVFWEPDDTISLRQQIVEDRIAAGRDVLEIGTGTGILSILCLQHDAKSVVATDINPAAVACAKYNAAILAPDQNLDVRLVPPNDPGAFSVLDEQETFDLILTNPPWEDGAISKPADHAFYDPNFALMDSLLDGLPRRLNPGGRCLLAYGNVPAIRRLKAEAEQRGYAFKFLDDRKLDELEENFLPGMLMEIRPPVARTVVSGNGFASPTPTETLPERESENPERESENPERESENAERESEDAARESQDPEPESERSEGESQNLDPKHQLPDSESRVPEPEPQKDDKGERQDENDSRQAESQP